MKIALTTFILPLLLAAEAPQAPAPRPISDAAVTARAIERALDRAGKNRGEIVKALENAPADQREGMVFLVTNMPDVDLVALHADYLLENLDLAYRARAQVPWGKTIPNDIFLNDVLPYANVNESREPWRKELFEMCLPIVKDCKTPGEAAQRLNSTLFEKLKVRYSTQRNRADQAPSESIKTGKASCTGLSILLSDACRSVAVPTRIVGTPLWANKRGNHTWVEVWDGDWHFTGACEADPKGLDRGWFTGDAAQAVKGSREHAIYASSFKKTGQSFPLVWAPGRKDVPAEDVTDRYTAKPAPKTDRVRVSVRVWLPGKAERLVTTVTVHDAGSPEKSFTGESRGATADRNDILAFELAPGREYIVRIGKPVRVEKVVKTEAGKDVTLEIEVPAEDKLPMK